MSENQKSQRVLSTGRAVIFLVVGLLLTNCQEKKLPSIPGGVSDYYWQSKLQVQHDCTIEYREGVNDALQTIMLHDLELKLKSQRMTWGERADTVRARLGLLTDGKGGKI